MCPRSWSKFIGDRLCHTSPLHISCSFHCPPQWSWWCPKQGVSPTDVKPSSDPTHFYMLQSAWEFYNPNTHIYFKNHMSIYKQDKNNKQWQKLEGICGHPDVRKRKMKEQAGDNQPHGKRSLWLTTHAHTHVALDGQAADTGGLRYVGPFLGPSGCGKSASMAESSCMGPARRWRQELIMDFFSSQASQSPTPCPTTMALRYPPPHPTAGHSKPIVILSLCRSLTRGGIEVHVHRPLLHVELGWP